MAVNFRYFAVLFNFRRHPVIYLRAWNLVVMWRRKPKPPRQYRAPRPGFRRGRSPYLSWTFEFRGLVVHWQCPVAIERTARQLMGQD